MPAGDGEFKVLGGGKDEYVRPKTVQECQQAMRNYRSALGRVWPWDWTGEALIKAMDDFGWLYYVQVSKVYEIGCNKLLIVVVLSGGEEKRGEAGDLH